MWDLYYPYYTPLLLRVFLRGSKRMATLRLGCRPVTGLVVWSEARSASQIAMSFGWWTVAYLVDVERLRKVDNDVADEDGATRGHMESVVSSNLVVRGWRDGGAFLAAWSAAGEGWKADCAYWWTRDREAWADLPRELVTWRTARPMPVRVSFRELKALLKMG